MRLRLKGAVFYYRSTLPSGKELNLSLFTGYKREAQRIAGLLAESQRRAIMGNPSMTDEEIKRAVREDLRRILREDYEARLAHDPAYKFLWETPQGRKLDVYESKREILPPFGSDIPHVNEVAHKVKAMVDSGKLEAREGSREYGLALYEYAKLFPHLLTSIQVRQSDKIIDWIKPELQDNPSLPATTEVIKSSMKLSELFERYFSNRKTKKELSESTKAEYPRRMQIFYDVIGDVDIAEINNPRLDEAYDIIKKLPDDYRKRLEEGISLSEILKEGGKPYTPNGLNQRWSLLSSVLKFGVQRGLLDRNYAEGYTYEDSVRTDEKRALFTKNELQLLMTCEKPNAATFYVTALLLYTGARLAEVCQLHVDDVREVDGCWFIDINDEHEKGLKNKQSKRIVPLHPVMVDDLRFIQFVNSRCDVGMRLFPELKLSNGKYGAYMTNWMNRWKRRNHIQPDMNGASKSFHSLRHHFTTTALQAGIPPHKVDWLTGHSQQGETLGRYGKPPTDPGVLMPSIMNLDFGIDLSSLKASKWVPKG